MKLQTHLKFRLFYDKIPVFSLQEAFTGFVLGRNILRSVCLDNGWLLPVYHEGYLEYSVRKMKEMQ